MHQGTCRGNLAVSPKHDPGGRGKACALKASLAGLGTPSSKPLPPPCDNTAEEVCAAHIICALLSVTPLTVLNKFYIPPDALPQITVLRTCWTNGRSPLP